MSNIRGALYAVAKAAVDAAVEGNTLFGVQLPLTVYDPATQMRAIRIGDWNADIAPGPGGVVEGWDILGKLEILSQPADETPEAMLAAEDDVWAITLAVAQLLVNDPTMGGRLHDSRILGGLVGWGSLKTVRHAVSNLNLIANETGAYRNG
jgi:hypothetical protein